MHSGIHRLLHSQRADQLQDEAAPFSNDPHRAAVEEALSRLGSTGLPAHRQHRVMVRLVEDFTRDSTNVVDEWTAYSDTHTDLDGWPEDDHAYGLRQRQRDADAAALFGPIRGWAGRLLLATAEVQLASLPTSAVQPRWGYQLGVLRDSLDQLDALDERWAQTVDSLDPGEGIGTPAYETALAEHHADSFSYIDAWITHGSAVREINTAARHSSSSLAPVPAQAPSQRAAARR